MFPSFFCGSISGAMLFKSIQWIGWENLQETIDFPNQEAQPRPVRLRLRMEKGGVPFFPLKTLAKRGKTMEDKLRNH